MAVELVVDGSADFLGGQDASKKPDKIDASAFAAGINVSVKRGVLQPRWGFAATQTDVWPEGYVLDVYKKKRSYHAVFETGKFQALAPYYIGNRPHLVIVVAGHIFVRDVEQDTVVLLPITDGSLINPRAARVNWSSAGRYLVLYDFPAYPVILDGLYARRANPANMEIPTAVLGAYNQNRLFIANAGSEFTGGDPVGSAAAPDAPITFQEIMLSGSPYYGQIFRLPTSDNNNPITFMGFLQVADTSTGIGPLLVATEQAVYSFNSQNPRLNWEGGQFGSMLCYNAGVVGPRAFANVNSDALFLARDGFVRSLSMSRNAQGSWARIPISREVENWFKFWDKSLIKYGFVGVFNNKCFFSVNPHRLPAVDLTTSKQISDYTHGGMVVLELDNLTSFGETVKPTWTGLWTGIRPMDMTVIGDRAFVMAKDGNANQLYEIDPNLTYDTADCLIRPIRSRVYTREYDFQDEYLNKELHSIDVNLADMAGEVSLKIDYKPTHAPCFLPWVDFIHQAPWRSSQVPCYNCLNGYAKHTIRDLTFGSPSEEQCSPLSSDYYKTCKKTQLRIDLTGIYWELDSFRLKALPQPDTGNITICDPFPLTEMCACCDDDWYVPDFSACDAIL